MKVQSYKELNVWQKGIELVDKVYQLTDRFPKAELYGLVTQLRRAAVSVPSNIAEGFARQYTKEYLQFLYISLGSCAELETQLIIAQRRGYISEQELKEMEGILDHECRMLANLLKSLSSK
jgi:four helix bundle protein